MRRYLLTCLGLGVGLLAAADPPPKPTPPPDNPVRNTTVPDKLNEYEGTYVVESGEEDGKPVPKERLAGSKVTITRDTITGTDAAGKKFFVATYAVDGTETPARWVLRPNESPDAQVLYALAEREGPTLRMVYNTPGGPKPTGFKTVKGQHLFVLKRATVDGVPPAEKK